MTKKIPRPLFFLGTILTFFLALHLLSIPKTTNAACTGKIKCEFLDKETGKCDQNAGYATTGCEVEFGVCGGNGCCGVPNSGCGCEIGDSCKVTGGCTPQCSDKECGPDGCGGSCGSCSGGETCNASGQCVGGPPPPVCNTTAPSNLSVTRLSPTQGRIDWTPGANGTKQLLRVGANLTEVNSGCPGVGSPACVVKEDNLPTSQTSYTTGIVLTSGTVYYWRVVNYKDDACYTGGSLTSLSSCQISPGSLSVQAGSTGSLISSVFSSGDISSVNYVSANTGIATVNPASDTTYVYQTMASGVSPGSTTVRNDAIIGGSVNCTANSSITVTNPGPWWQVRDADLTTNGDIISPIPGTCVLPVCNPVLGLRGLGGFPGVPAYGGATADFQAGAGTGRAAEDPYNWLVNSRYNGRTYDYAYFERQIPDDIVINELTLIPPVTGGTFNSGGTPSRGYVWYHWDGETLGDLTINGNINLVGNRRVVLMVEAANLIINGRIQLQSPGQGFFMVVVGKDANNLKGNIIVDPSVDDIEGIYLAEGQFRTGIASSQLQVRGSVAAYDGVVLQRDLGDANEDTPSEYFEYAPDIIATFPRVFTQRRMRWKEVAP